MTTRLQTLSPELAERLRSASASQLRAAGLTACAAAVARAKVGHPLAGEALEDLRRAGTLSTKIRAELDALAARLDDRSHQCALLDSSMANS